MSDRESLIGLAINRHDESVIRGASQRDDSPILGYTDTNFPEEIAIAAGFLPIIMTGDPHNGLQLVGEKVDPESALPVRYLYEAILGGRYDFVELICVSGGDRWMTGVPGFLEAEKYLDPSSSFPDCHFIERLKGTYHQHRRFNRDRLKDFRSFLSEFASRPISDDDLFSAIQVTNASRRLLAELSALRRREVPALLGSEALQIIVASMLMPKGQYNLSLRRCLDEYVANQSRTLVGRRRIFVSGSSVEHPCLYETIESLGAVIVGEGSAFGDRYAKSLVAEDLDPIEALADRYTYKPLDPWMLGMEERVRFRIEEAKRARADGVIFFHMKNDDPIGWDYPTERRGLEELGIPILLLAEQGYDSCDNESLSASIEEFIGTLPGGD